MTIDPILAAPAHVLVHAGSAMIAVLIGPYALYGSKGRGHKRVGYVWVLAMAIMAVSSFWITSFGIVGPFSPIHLLAVLTLWSLYQALRHVFAGRISLHKTILRSLYWTGLMVAGLVNFLPGRMINRTFFPQTPEAGYVVMAVGGVALAAIVLRSRIPLRVRAA